jgi:hypothetical protein
MSEMHDVVRAEMGEDGQDAIESMACALIEFRQGIEAALRSMPKSVVEKLASHRRPEDKTFMTLYDRLISVEAFHWLLLCAQVEKAKAAGADIWCVYHDQDMKLCDPKDHGMESSSDEG